MLVNANRNTVLGLVFPPTGPDSINFDSPIYVSYFENYYKVKLNNFFKSMICVFTNKQNKLNTSHNTKK